MRRAVPVVVAVLAALPLVEATAQTREINPRPPTSLPQQSFPDLDDGPTTFSRIVTGVGGALLGAGLGFFASQVVRGDWQDEHRPINRSLWAVTGGAVGLAIGVRFPLSLGGRGSSGRPGLPTGRLHLGRADMVGRGIDNAYEAVELLRPEWLRIRGSQSLAPGLDPVVVSGRGTPQVTGSTPLNDDASTIQVYVDGVHLGGIATLTAINPFNISDLYFFDAAKATARFGGRNPHGAILVIT
jgi:hypothetical protein